MVPSGSTHMASVFSMDSISAIPSSKERLKQAVETASATPELGVRIETAAKVSFGKRVSGSIIWWYLVSPT